jgi:hypothetical protein
MDDNARPRRSRAVTTYLQSEAMTSVPWPAMSPDLNPIDHIWDMLGNRAAAIRDAMLLPADECFAQEVPEPVYDCLTCPKYDLWDSNPGSWLAKEQKLEG